MPDSLRILTHEDYDQRKQQVIPWTPATASAELTMEQVQDQTPQGLYYLRLTRMTSSLLLKHCNGRTSVLSNTVSNLVKEWITSHPPITPEDP